MKDYDKAIQAIISFKESLDDLNIEKYKKMSNDLIGLLGEFYVLDELQKRGYKNIVHKRPQSGFDIYLGDCDKGIEVRASLIPKSEDIYHKKGYTARDYPVEFYGWTVLKRKELMPKYDILIGVGFDRDTLKNPVYYIFNVDEVNRIDEVKLGWPNNVKKKIHLFLDDKSYNNALLLRPEIIKEYERFIIENPSQFQDKWKKINKVV